MTKVAETADWLRTERTRLGLSASQIATLAMKIADDAGDPLTLTQQAVSGFENGRWKTVPRWMRFVREAIATVAGEPTAVTEIRQPTVLAQSIQMNVLLPSANALTQMFDALLLGFPEGVPRAELAEGLARRLPVALAQLQGPLFEMDKDESSVPASGVPPHATGRRARPSPPNS